MLSTNGGGVPGSWFFNRIPKVVGKEMVYILYFVLTCG